MSYAQDLQAFLETNLIDPANRTLQPGQKWITIGQMPVDYKDVGYPLVIVGLPSYSSQSKRLGKTQQIRVVFDIEVITEGIKDQDNLVNQIKDNCLFKPINTLRNPKILSVSVTPNVIDNTNVYQGIISIAFTVVEYDL